jgi:tetratricopeptide (TPR) repeat protein
MSIFEYMKCTTFLLWLFISCSAFAQNEQIAKDFFEKGDYEKALASYEGLYKKQRRLNYFIRIIGCHQQLEQFEKAGNLLNRELNKRSIQPQLYIELGYNYQLQNNMPEAEKSYAQALQLIQENPNYAYTIGRSFEKYNLLDYAITCYQDASALNERLNFSFNIARIYGEQGKIEQMFSNYLDLMSTNETYTSAALRNINQYLTEDPQNEANILFKKVLLKKLQSEPNSLWNEQLSWLYVQQKEFKKAFIQEKALYKRRPESLQRIINIAEIAMQTEANEAASKILSFIATTSQIKQTQLFAKRYLLQIQVKNAKKQEYQAIASQYAVLLKEFSAQTEAYNVAIDYAHFLAFYNEKTPEAVSVLKEQLDRPLSKLQKASIKMELADILVLEQKFNQALIYYSQIQTKLKNSEIAQLARFKVAKTSYYKGDFKWALQQTSVLKSSTSQLIANDALALHLLIKDNSLEDSTQTALKKYAKADLLAFQNKKGEAIGILDDVLSNHKGEKIEDEALFKQAKIFESEKNYIRACENYLKIIEFFKEEFLVDDALFYLAILYADQLDKPELAKQFLEDIVFNHADSIHYVDARKKYRSLRGDVIE